ncbi:asparaginase domain-containing protein [Streptomyces sp. NPDC050211]|uniref:asparaginase domain-containing protein n=1 Tax=Streptomyces sp. NPDC050211 TaxID=3154932 RepID=UPI00342C1409
MRIHVITTGGSIDVEYSLQGTLVIGQPMAVPILERARTLHEFTVESVCRKDSAAFDDADRDLIRHHVRTADAEHILITHGTDTMTTTAEHLRDLTGKVIVMTGAIQPARMTDSDAPFNLGLAVAALQTLPHGVHIAMSGRILPAGQAQKDRARGIFL